MCSISANQRLAIFTAVHDYRRKEVANAEPREGYRPSLLRRDPAEWKLEALDLPQIAGVQWEDPQVQLYAWICYLGPRHTMGAPPEAIFQRRSAELEKFPRELQESFAVQLAVATGCALPVIASSTPNWTVRWVRAQSALFANIQGWAATADRWLAGKVAGYPGSRSCRELRRPGNHCDHILRAFLDPLAPLPEPEMTITCAEANDAVIGKLNLGGSTQQLLRGNKRVFSLHSGGALLLQSNRTEAKLLSGAILRLAWSRDSGGNDHVKVAVHGADGGMEREVTLKPGEQATFRLRPGSLWAAWECGCGRLKGMKCETEHRLSAWNGWLKDKPLSLWTTIGHAVKGPPPNKRPGGPSAGSQQSTNDPVKSPTAASFSQGIYYAALNTWEIA